MQSASAMTSLPPAGLHDRRSPEGWRKELRATHFGCAAALRDFHQHWYRDGCLDWVNFWQHRVQLRVVMTQFKLNY
jgi:hypothetical protein